MQPAAYETRYFDSVVPDAEGVAGHEWKAWVYEGDRVMWELRRPLLLLFERRPLAVSEMLKRDLREWVLVCESLFGEGSITMSARQAMARQIAADVEADPYLRGEHSCSTSALLVLFAWVMLHRRKNVERTRALALAASFFERLLPAGRQLECLRACPAEASDECQAEPMQNGVCFCLRFAAAKASDAASSEPGLQGLVRLKELLVFADCMAVRHWIRAQVVAFQAVIDAAVRSLEGCADPLRSRAALTGQKRNLRIDEDFKAATFTAVQQGRAHSVETLQGALGDPRGAGSKTWHHERMQLAMASGWLVGSRGGTFCIAADGSRFGNPAEETIAYAWWHPASEVGGWLPVQAPTWLPISPTRPFDIPSPPSVRLTFPVPFDLRLTFPVPF